MATKESEDRNRESVEPELVVNPPASDQAAGGQVPGAQVDPASLEFETVDFDPSAHDYHRDPSGATVAETGRTLTNTSGHMDFTTLAERASLDPLDFALQFGVSEERQQISLYAVSPHVKGAAPVRRDMKRKVTTVYLHTIFKKYPKLKVKGTKLCSMLLTKDAKGRECILISLGTALSK